MKIAFHDPEGRFDARTLDYARSNRPRGEKSTIWCSVNLGMAFKGLTLFSAVGIIQKFVSSSLSNSLYLITLLNVITYC